MIWMQTERRAGRSRHRARNRLKSSLDEVIAFTTRKWSCHSRSIGELSQENIDSRCAASTSHDGDVSCEYVAINRFGMCIVRHAASQDKSEQHFTAENCMRPRGLMMPGELGVKKKIDTSFLFHCGTLFDAHYAILFAFESSHSQEMEAATHLHRCLCWGKSFLSHVP